MTASSTQDQWAQWLLQRRHGGDAEQQEAMVAKLGQTRDQVLDRAGIVEGDVLLDVGAGDGLIAFGALPLIGPHGKVIFSDISQDLLHHSRDLATRMGVLDRIEFLQAPADDLSAISDASVDVVTTRSVLIYVERKHQAWNEFHRVLKPGGRVSSWEPINSYAFPEPNHLLMGVEVTPIQEIANNVEE